MHFLAIFEIGLKTSFFTTQSFKIPNFLFNALQLLGPSTFDKNLATFYKNLDTFDKNLATFDKIR